MTEGRSTLSYPAVYTSLVLSLSFSRLLGYLREKDEDTVSTRWSQLGNRKDNRTRLPSYLLSLEPGRKCGPSGLPAPRRTAVRHNLQ